MAFCGQCGLLLNTNTTKCPRCGAATDFDVATPGTPEDDNVTTVIAHTDNPQTGNVPYTPLSPSLPFDTGKATYHTVPEENAYPEQNIPQVSHPQSSSYPIPGAFQSSFPQRDNTYTAPGASASNAMSESIHQAPGIYPSGSFPATNAGYPFQPPIPLRKRRVWPVILVIVIIVALAAVTVMFFALGPGLFGINNTPIAQTTPTGQPVSTSTQQNTPTQAATPGTTSTLQAQATIQHYYADINNQDYQNAYNLWVSNPDNYTHYKQGFAHTHHDAITFGNAISQVDGTVQVNITVQATEDTSGGGTQTSTYQGYYIVGQQTDGNWKIISGQLA